VTILLKPSLGRKPKLGLDVIAVEIPAVEAEAMDTVTLLKEHTLRRRRLRLSQSAELLGFDGAVGVCSTMDSVLRGFSWIL
jgi:hypothetical protein